MIDEALRAIAEPRRRAILGLIGRQELTAGAIAMRFSVTRPAISQHLGVLESAGLVSVRREGARRYYRMRPEGLGELRDFIESFWDESLARLAKAAEHEERRHERDKPANE